MPTEEWFKENPKVSAYISKELNEKLSEWMQSRNVKKVSQALTTILEEYLELGQNSPTTQSSGRDRLEALEQKVETLTQIVETLQRTIPASSSPVTQNEPKKIDGQLELLETNTANEPTESEQSQESSLPVEESRPSSEKQQERLPDLMPTPKVVDFLSSTHNAISGKHRRGEVIEEKGYRFTPEPKDKKRGRLNWKVEPI